MLRINNINQVSDHKVIIKLTHRDDETRDMCMKILVVEDNPINQKIAKLFLESFGYTVDIAANGQEALEMANRDYALILMDIGLPDMDGIEITQNIRQKNKNVPIIACTASGESYRDKCLNAGMNDFILKPIMSDDLKILIKKYI